MPQLAFIWSTWQVKHMQWKRHPPIFWEPASKYFVIGFLITHTSFSCLPTAVILCLCSSCAASGHEKSKQPATISFTAYRVINSRCEMLNLLMIPANYFKLLGIWKCGLTSIRMVSQFSHTPLAASKPYQGRSLEDLKETVCNNIQDCTHTMLCIMESDKHSSKIATKKSPPCLVI